MVETARRLVAFTVSASVVAYAVFLMAGSVIEVQAREHGRVVWVRDVISPDIHRLSGSVTVDSTCAELSVKPVAVSPIAYRLEFKTWEQPDVECAPLPTARPFHTVVFAPAVGIQFIATLDNKPLPLIVAPATPHE